MTTRRFTQEELKQQLMGKYESSSSSKLFTRTEANATHLVPVPHIFHRQIPRRAASPNYASTLIYITFM